MHRVSRSVIGRSLWRSERCFCTSSDQKMVDSSPRKKKTNTIINTSPSKSKKIVASVLFERLPLIIPKIDPVVYAFQEFSFRWRNQFRRIVPDEFYENSTTRDQGGESLFEYVPAPRITEADKTNDKKSLNRALDRRLYLLLYGNAYGSDEPVWHFPEKVYESEDTIRKCAELALEGVIGDLSTTYFLGNAPMAYKLETPKMTQPGIQFVKRFFFKSQVVGTGNKYDVKKCEDFVWANKDEILEYFPKEADFYKKLIIS